LRVASEQKVSLPVRDKELDLLLGVYEIPIIGRVYSVRSALSNIISIGILPNDITDEEAITIATRVFEKGRKEFQKHLVVRREKSVVPLLSLVEQEPARIDGVDTSDKDG